MTRARQATAALEASSLTVGSFLMEGLFLPGASLLPEEFPWVPRSRPWAPRLEQRFPRVSRMLRRFRVGMLSRWRWFERRCNQRRLAPLWRVPLRSCLDLFLRTDLAYGYVCRLQSQSIPFIRIVAMRRRRVVSFVR